MHVAWAAAWTPDYTLADLGRRITAAVEREIGIDPGAVRVGSSVGWALGEDCGWSFDELLNRADRMMYQAKADRRSAPAGGTPRARPRPGH